MAKKIYIISNSHLDPVWIWRRRSGRSAWTNTMHSVANMMAKHPDVKFTCSAAALYRWIEETEPALFSKIGKLVEAGRWEIVGGWEVQADAIVSSAESLIRQGLVAKEYIKSKFGVDVKTGYSVDSFGHSAGLPKILKATGMDNYVFLRPMDGQMKLPLLFDWKADDGTAVRALHIKDTYSSDYIPKEWFMDRIAAHIRDGLDRQTLFVGLGDHGGGLSETQYGWLKEAQEKYDAEIVFSTLGEYFEETKTMDVPSFSGELSLVFPGCYTACHEVKREIAVAMQRLTTAEKLGASPKELEEPLREVLFNHFHDIFPGTCIMEAYRSDIFPSIGSVISKANMLADRALCRRTSFENTLFMDEGGLYIKNTEPVSKTAPVSVTGFADPNNTGYMFKSLRDRDGNRIPLQLLPPPTTFGPCNVPWANLTAVISLPPNGEIFLAYDPISAGDEPNLGFDRQREFLKKLSFSIFYDDFGTWGFEFTHYKHSDGNAELVATEEIADGPVASVLRAKYRVRSSEIQLDVTRFAGINELKLNLMIKWQEERSCLKLAYDHGLSDFTFATGVSASHVERMKGTRARSTLYPAGAVQIYPFSNESVMHDWCAVVSQNGRAAFFSADIHGCDHAEGLMRLTLLRSVPYADHHPFPRNEQTGYMDIGMTFMELWFSDDAALDFQNAAARAQQCLTPLEEMEVTAHEAGPAFVPPEYPLAFDNPNLVLLSAHLVEDGLWELHLMNYGDETVVELPEKDYKLAPNSLNIIRARS